MMTSTNTINDTILCLSPSSTTSNGIWEGNNPLDYSLPLFILQLTLVIGTTRLMVFLLKPFRQPRVISEILGGIILGPSVLGRISNFANTIFPLRSVVMIDTMANIGLLYFLFLVGLEMDITVIRRTGKKAMAIAVSGMVLPFVVGTVFSFILYKKDGSMTQGSFILVVGVSLSVTAFPVLARILAELKLINTELGRIALSSALANDMCAWVLLALAIAFADHQSYSFSSLWVFLSNTAFVGFCIFVVRPAISWMIHRTPEGETISELYISLILTGVMISGFITGAIGTHSVFGAFVFGLIIPNGPIVATLTEKLEDFVSGLLLPLFFSISGLRTNISAIKGPRTWGFLLLINLLACAGKVTGTLLISVFYQMPVREGITLGLLMNTKGLIELIVLNVGMDYKVLDDESFAVLVVTAVIMTGIIMPIITSIYKPTRRIIPYKKRTIQISKSGAELRVVVCIHNLRNVPTIINLLEASHPTRNSPICTYVLHLVELTGRASAMLIAHNTRKSGQPALNQTQAQSDLIINAFENYEQHAGGCVSIQSLTAISPYSTMHEDICNLAEDKGVAFIIIPFHKQQTIDGRMDATNLAFQNVNWNVLASAPCSVGILVDRGLNGSTRLAATNLVSHHIAVLFFGGPDDREALAYAWRMSEHPGISLTVLHFIPGEDAIEPAVQFSNEIEREKQLDKELIKEFRMNTSKHESIMYSKKVVNNGEETVRVIRSMESVHDLFIVGRGQEMISPLTAGLSDWSEYPELGAIGDILASSDFSATVSVLVVQQGEELGTPDSKMMKLKNRHPTPPRGMRLAHDQVKSRRSNS